jgi:TP901 family phage tail tape measure protein
MVDLVNIGLAVDSSQVKEGRQELDKFGNQAKKTEKATDKLLSAFKKYASLAAVYVAVWKVIDAHREFSKAVSELSSITGATGQDLKFYREQALQMGASTTFMASEVVQAFKLVASAKPELLASRDALAQVTREVLTLAEASGMQLPDAATALAGSLNQFGAGAEQASRYINVLAAGAKFGSSEINETAEAMKNAGAVAASMSLSFEETNAAIQALSANSLKGAEAGTGLRGVLLKLAKDGRDEFNPEIVGLERALLNLRDANLTTTEKMDLFGQESITAATALIEQADKVGELTRALTGTSTAYEQARINTNNLDGDIKAMGSSWERVALILGNTFDPALRFTAQSLTWAGKVAATASEEVGDLGDMLGAYAAIAVAVSTLDWQSVETVLAARREQRKEADARISKIWEEKDAVEKKAESEVKAAETIKQVEEERKAREYAAAASSAPAKISDDDREKLERQLDMMRKHYADDQELALIAYQEKQAKLAELEEYGIVSEEEARQLAFEAQWEFEEKMLKIEEDAANARISIKEQEMRAKQQAEQSFWSSAIGLMSSGSKQMFEIGKAAAISRAVIDGYSAAIAAWDAGMSTGGPWAPLVAAGYASASLLKTGSMIGSLQSASYGGGGGVSVGSGGAVNIGADFNGGAGPAGQPMRQEEKPAAKEVRVTFEGESIHSNAMRKFAADLGETLRDMGSDVDLVLS